MSAPAAKPQPRILVIRGGAIGDFILTLPALQLIRETIIGCHLEVLGYPGICDLAVLAGLADHTRSLEGRSMAMLFAPGAKIDEEVAAYLTSFTLVISYLYDPDGFLRGNMERLGVKTYLELPHRVIDGAGHATEQLARPLESLAMWLDPGTAPRIIKREATGLPVEKSQPRIALHPGSGSLRKTWPTEHWIATGHALRRRWPQAQLTLITGEAEEERGTTAQLIQAWQSLDYEHWRNLPLTELAQRLANCRAFLGHDSGISHLAAACGVPCHVFFGPTDSATWRPLGQAGVQVCQAPLGSLEQLSLQAGLASLEAFLEAKL